MQRRPLRDELRDAFDAMSEPAHPALASRIREEIRSQPTGAGVAIPRLAAVIAALVAVVRPRPDWPARAPRPDGAGRAGRSSFAACNCSCGPAGIARASDRRLAGCG